MLLRRGATFATDPNGVSIGPIPTNCVDYSNIVSNRLASLVQAYAVRAH